MNSRLIEAFLIAVGIVLLGVFIRQGIVEFKQMDRVVSVKGLAEMEVDADRVTWPIAYTIVGNDLQSLYAEMKQKDGTIVDFLAKGSLVTSDYSLSAPTVVDTKADRYSSQTLSYRYTLTSIITVSSSKVAEVNRLIKEQGVLLNKGIAILGGDYRFTTTYEYTGLNGIKPQMIEQATKSARSAAEQFAKDSDSKIGKIRRASQGQFSISDLNSNTPERKIIRVVSTVDYELKN
ncbi:MAG: SIMPL domain-containing protein [Bacteroidales bacterium]